MLGDRVLYKGLYGVDVKELVTLLISKLYLNEDDVERKNGYYLFNGSVETAVKNFQKDAGLKQTGKVDSSLVAKLKSWDSSNTTIMLGIRELSPSISDQQGYDVTQLVELLTKAGYAPNPSKIKKNGNKTVFTDDVVMAVRMFQAYNNMPVTGRVDRNTINKLRTKAK